MQSNKIKVAFLDRDGVINKEVNYLHKIDDFEYTTDCLDGLANILSLGYEIIIITNQAGIAKGYYTEEEYYILTSWIRKDLASKGIRILDVFHCPHHPDGVVPSLSIKCDCRKPSPGMIDYAMQKYDIDIDQSILIGDKISDIQAGQLAGINSCYLVKTGHPITECSSGATITDNILTASILIKNF